MVYYFPNTPPIPELRINNTAALGLLTSVLGFTVASLTKNSHLSQLLFNTAYTSGLLAYVGTVGRAVLGFPQWESTIRLPQKQTPAL